MLKKEELIELANLYKKDRKAKILNRMLNKVSLTDLIADKDTEYDLNFNINIKTHGSVKQYESGRCWAFANLNILREKIIQKCNLKEFELSGSYIAFYDKIERFNKRLENINNYVNERRNLYDRYVSDSLSNGISDGGWFTQIAHLINKYGIVPKSVFPETYHSSNTYEINQILSRLLRKFYLEIENKRDDINIIKDKYFNNAYKIISSVYGIPCEKFDFEYIDTDGIYHIDQNLTPKEFYKKYIDIDLLNNYVEIGSYSDNKYKYDNMYQFEETSQISGVEDLVMLNIKIEEMKDLMLKQLKDGEPVYFYCSTTVKRIEGIWIDTMDRYSEIFDVDLRLDNNDIIKTNGRTGQHCMLFTGVKTIDNKPIKWKMENSWGDKYGIKGDYIADDDWVNKYVYMVVINKKHLDKNQQKILTKKAIRISKWDAKLD